MTAFTATGSGRPDVGVVEARGNLDAAADAGLTEAYESATLDAPPVVVLDLAAVDYINSTGIALIVGLLTRTRREGRELRVSGLTAHYRHIFEITRLADVISIHDTLDEAVGGGAVALP